MPDEPQPLGRLLQHFVRKEPAILHASITATNRKENQNKLEGWALSSSDQ
jgi:hypothetical protein